MNNVEFSVMIPVALKPRGLRTDHHQYLNAYCFCINFGRYDDYDRTPPNIIISSLGYELLNELHISAKEGIDSTAVNYFNIKNINIDSYEPTDLVFLTYLCWLIRCNSWNSSTYNRMEVDSRSSQNKRNTNSFKIDDYD